MADQSTDPFSYRSIPRAPRGYVNVLIGGVLFERLTIKGAPHNGRCHRSGVLFLAGATIGFLEREVLTANQIKAVFKGKSPKHITVLLTPEEIDPPPVAPVVLPEPSEIVRCLPDPVKLERFRDLMAHNEYPSNPSFNVHGTRAEDWGMGNIWTRAVAYSCGHLTRDDRPLDHKHDPAEMEFCECIANEIVSKLSQFEVSEGGKIEPFFAAAIVGTPVPEVIDEAIIRQAFGGTLAPELLFQSQLMMKRSGHWDRMEGLWIPLDSLPAEAHENGDFERYIDASWDEFAEWWISVPGLREHTVIGIGYSDGDPGVLKPRLMLALSTAGSLVGVMSYVAQA